MVSLSRTIGLGLLLAALGLGAPLLLPTPTTAAQAQPSRQSNAATATDKAKGGDEQRLSEYDRESLALDRAANGIAEAANIISADQRTYALVQVFLGGFGVLFTAIAAGAAIAAAVYASKSATADNDALSETRAAAERARKDAAEQAERFDAQIKTSHEGVVAAKRSADAAVAMQRPWIKLDIEFRSPPEWRGNGEMWVSFEVRALNSGRNPALKVRVVSRVDPFDMQVGHDPGIAKVLAGAAEGWSNYPILFPDELIREGGYAGPVKSSDVIISACAAYRIDGSDCDHFTAISFRVSLEHGVEPVIRPEGAGHVT